MFVFGAMGLLVALSLWFIVRDRPSMHFWCNTGEVTLIDSRRPAGVPAPGGPVKAVPMTHILKSRSLWLVGFNQFSGNVGWVFWSPGCLAICSKYTVFRWNREAYWRQFHCGWAGAECCWVDAD